MRRHATAHLGKIERELRPTVIVTESDTVLLGNQEKESRRIKRVPKKFDDYMNTGSKTISDSDEPAPKKQKVKSDYQTDESFKYRVRQPDLNQTVEELKSIRDEVKKMVHVSVDVRRLEYLDDLEPWCLVHKLYKCQCRGALMTGEAFTFKPPSMETAKSSTSSKPLPMETKPQPMETKPQTIDPKTQHLPHLLKIKQLPPRKHMKEPTPELTLPTLPTQEEEELIDDGFSRRVLPVKFDANKEKESPVLETKAIIKSGDGLPKIEIVNLSELINGGIGPIYINIYDDKTMRLNQILRSILNNKSAIIYFDGFAYFVDKKRVDIRKLIFSQMKDELDHPIFILQAKDDFPPPVSSTMSDDFVKFLFKKDSNSFIQISDKTSLKEIAEIIESILRNVRKKLESQIGEDSSDLVKEQLLMITRDRSRSRSSSASISSTNSSPLHFQGLKLTEAPPPGVHTPLMQEFNKIFSSRMQRLVSMVSSNTLGLRPSEEMLNKFYIYQWSLLLKSFEEDLVQIWQVRLESESGNGYQMMVLTETRDLPEIEHANKEDIVNIRKLTMSDNITELTRLILLRVEKATMKNMTILFYGCKGYLRVCGILNSKEPYKSGFVAKPSRTTHPRIAAKIQKIYHIWHGSKIAREKKRTEELEKENREQEAVKLAQLKMDQEAQKKTQTFGSNVKKVKCSKKIPLKVFLSF